MQRIRQGTAATLEVVYTDSDGEPAAAPAAVTVAVVRGDGSTVLAAGTATSPGSGTGRYTVAMTAAHTSLLDELTATWTSSGVTRQTKHRVVGGFVFSISDARATDRRLADTAEYPTATLVAKRTEVEEELEWICDRAFVPSYRRLLLDGNGTPSLVTGVWDIRRLRSIGVYPTTGSSTATAFTAGQLAQVAVFDDGQIRRTDGGVFPDGLGNVAVEVEFGLDAPPADLAPAAMIRLRDKLGQFTTQIPDRGRTWTAPDGTTIDLGEPDAYRTGIFEVDSIYARHSRRHRPIGGPAAGGGVQVVPASRPLNFDPQYFGLFRGGER